MFCGRDIFSAFSGEVVDDVSRKLIYIIIKKKTIFRETSWREVAVFLDLERGVNV